jgi:predicted RNase H-like nuclease (RuvC/YqgF family)
MTDENPPESASPADDPSDRPSEERTTEAQETDSETTEQSGSEPEITVTTITELHRHLLALQSELTGLESQLTVLTEQVAADTDETTPTESAELESMIEELLRGFEEADEQLQELSTAGQMLADAYGVDPDGEVDAGSDHTHADQKLWRSVVTDTDDIVRNTVSE